MLSFLYLYIVCPPFDTHTVPSLLYLMVVCAQGLLDDGRRASTIAMGLNKQDKDHLVVRENLRYDDYVNVKRNDNRIFWL